VFSNAWLISLAVRDDATETLVCAWPEPGMVLLVFLFFFSTFFSSASLVMRGDPLRVARSSRIHEICGGERR
jgi:hypothetical protein